MTGLIYHRPADPISFLHSCLDDARKRDCQYSWNCFITSAGSGAASRSVFSRSKPLPPIHTEPLSVASNQTASANNNDARTPEKREATVAQGSNRPSEREVTVTTTASQESCDGVLDGKPLVFVLGKNALWIK